MKRRPKYRSILLILIFTLVMALLSMNVLKRNRYYETSERKFYGFFAMVRYALIDYPIETFTNFSEDLAVFWDRRYENDALKNNLENASLWEQKVKELESEIEVLKALNELDSLYTEYEFVSGRVKNRSYETWNEVLTINVGENQGVSINDGVITPQGIIGKVFDVSSDQASVILITSNRDNSKMAIKVHIDDSNFIYGIVNQYHHDTQEFELQLLDGSKTILESMEVTTSGIGGIYPAGLRLGQVSRIKSVPDGVGVVVYVKSDVDFDGVSYLKVVKLP